MATYILLMTLTPEGQKVALHDPEYLLRVEEAIRVPGVTPLGIYGVLGEYDFVTIVEAADNERMARFSLELGVGAKVHITTMPAIPISRLDLGEEVSSFEAVAELDDDPEVDLEEERQDEMSGSSPARRQVNDN